MATRPPHGRLAGGSLWRLDGADARSPSAIATPHECTTMGHALALWSTTAARRLIASGDTRVGG
jgi:hypothetical protein